MKYGFIKAHTNSYPLSVLCRVIGVSRSGYYQWQKAKSRQRRIEEARLLVLIRKHHRQSKGRYGLRRLVKAISREGVHLNKKRVYRIMKKYGIYSITRKKFRVTTKQAASAWFSKNLLEGNFNAVQNNQVWTSDITYIGTSEGWMYLAVILDAYNREIIGWSMDRSMTSEIVLKALRMAVVNRRPMSGVIFHSDRGSQYTSSMVRNMLSQYGFRQSMSGKGNCYDNAITETFFATLKKELVYLTKFETREEALREVFEFIEIYYNRQRLHSSLGYLSPANYDSSNRITEEINSRVAFLSV